MASFAFFLYYLFYSTELLCFSKPCESKVSKFEDSSAPWNLPVVPHILPTGEQLQKLMFSNSNGKLIPRHLWMAFKEVPKPSDRKDYLNRMFLKNTKLNWTLHLEDNEGKLNFMQKYYNGTSLLWAYKAIHHQVGNSAADIWRYGVLWLFGGLYMDDDSYFESSFDEVSNYIILYSYKFLISSTAHRHK